MVMIVATEKKSSGEGKPSAPLYPILLSTNDLEGEFLTPTSYPQMAQEEGLEEREG